MNTHDMIELPPPHIPDLEDELTAVLCAAISWGGSVISTEEYMAAKQRFRDAVNAAIEADRQSRGEPVGYIMPTALKQLKAGGNAIVGGVSQGFDVPIYTAPQPAEPDLAKCAECGAEMIHVRPGKWQHPDCPQSPWAAEPVKVPSDGDIMVEWASTPNTGDMRVDLVVFARTLLARYGANTQEQP